MAAKEEARRYLILDHVERIREADVLAVLLRVREYTGEAIHTPQVPLPQASQCEELQRASGDSAQGVPWLLKHSFGSAHPGHSCQPK